eukprot:4890266-Amphidinium_carterae.1
MSGIITICTSSNNAVRKRSSRRVLSKIEQTNCGLHYQTHMSPSKQGLLKDGSQASGCGEEHHVRRANGLTSGTPNSRTATAKTIMAVT